MTRNITLKIQLKFCGISGSQVLMHLSYLELLMGRIYTKHAMSYSWRGIMQSVFCINPS